MCNIRFWELSFWLFNLFTLGRKFDSSRLNVTERDAKNLFIPVSKDWGGVAFAAMAGSPWNRMTRSAR